MVNVSIKNLKLFEVLDEEASQVYYGGWQEWYGVWWKRMSGCGPTTVSNILNYIGRSQNDAAGSVTLTKGDFQELMEDVWKYVTPGMQGIASTAALRKGAEAYIESKKLGILIEELDVPKKKQYRPLLKDVLSFLGTALENDAPVAFLSLDKGKEELLDTWHWVTLLSLEYEEDGGAAFADVADEGKLLHVDLKKWFDTTKIGGGFVRFIENGSIPPSV